MKKKPFNQQKNRKSFFPRLAEGYRNTTLFEKIGALGAVIILCAALAFNAGSNPVLIAASILGIFVIINLIAYRASLMLAGVVFAIHIAALPYAATGYSFMMPGEYSGDIMSPLSILAFATLVFSILAYRFARGRYWLSLIFIFFSLDYLGIVLSALLGLNWGTGTALIMATVALVFRTIPWSSILRKNDNFISPTLANSSQDHLTKKLFEDKKYNVVALEDKWPLSHIAYSKKRIFLVSTFTPRRSLILNKERFYYDGAFIEPMIFEIVKTANEWCREHKIDSKFVTTVALVNNPDMFPSSDSVLSIQIAEKGDNHSLGHLHLATPLGIAELDSEEVPYFPFKAYQKLEKEYPHA